MITPEAFEKFIQDIQKQIDEADNLLKQKATNTLKSNFANYQNELVAYIASELKLAKEALQVGDDRRANVHRVRAEVFKSALDAVKG
jgi:hypothetical protein